MMRQFEEKFLNLKEKRKRQGGFTLIELMVVICILGILASIAIGQYKDAVALATGRAVMSNLRIINGAIEGYNAQYGKYPNADNTGVKELVRTGFLVEEPRGLKKGERYRVASKGPIFEAGGDAHYMISAATANFPNEAILGGMNLSELIKMAESGNY